MSWCIVYLASPRSHHIYNDPTQFSRLELLQGSVSIARAIFPTTDILVFHEDYTEEDMASLPEVTAFLSVDFTGREELCNRGLRRPYGYLMMCRFFSGIMQSHPEVMKYTHYMRLDDDSYFMEPWLTPDRVTQSLLKHDYVFRSTFRDPQDQQSLWEFTLDFLRKEGYETHVETLKAHLRRTYFLVGDWYTGLSPYNNFHIASQRLWQNPLTQRYIRALDESNGILQRGWMDANIHGMVIYVLTLFMGMKIHHEASFGYRHNVHVSVLHSDTLDYQDSLPFGASQRQPIRSAPCPSMPHASTPDASEDTH
jgi:hypothetical protein